MEKLQVMLNLSDLLLVFLLFGAYMTTYHQKLTDAKNNSVMIPVKALYFFPSKILQNLICILFLMEDIFSG